MRRTITITSALVAIAALATLPASGTAAKAKRVTQITCTFELATQGPPQGVPPTTSSFGIVACPRPLGAGVHHNSATVTPTAPGHGTTAVSFKKYFDRGTIRGTVAGTFAATNATDVTYEGTVTVTGGTGKFKHVKGGGQLRCTSSDGGPHKSCTVEFELTGV